MVVKQTSMNPLWKKEYWQSRASVCSNDRVTPFQMITLKKKPIIFQHNEKISYLKWLESEQKPADSGVAYTLWGENCTNYVFILMAFSKVWGWQWEEITVLLTGETDDDRGHSTECRNHERTKIKREDPETFSVHNSHWCLKCHV